MTPEYPSIADMRLRFPVELPGGRLERVKVSLNRSGYVDPNEEGALLARIIGVPKSLMHEIAEFDLVRICLKIEELNAPFLAAMEPA